MYLKVIIETLLFTAQQNIAQRSSAENRADIKMISDENRGNFIELPHLVQRHAAKTFFGFLANYNNSKQNMHSGFHHVFKMNCLQLLEILLESLLLRMYRKQECTASLLMKQQMQLMKSRFPCA